MAITIFLSGETPGCDAKHCSSTGTLREAIYLYDKYIAPYPVRSVSVYDDAMPAFGRTDITALVADFCHDVSTITYK